jgi:hypothetical protein
VKNILLYLDLLACFALVGCGCTQENPGALKKIYSIEWSKGFDDRLLLQVPNQKSISIEYLKNPGQDLMKVCLNRRDNFIPMHGVPRAEVAFDFVPRFAEGREYEVRWSTFMPSSYRFDNLQPEIIMQIHQSSNIGSPPFALMLNGEKYRVETRGGSGASMRAFEFGHADADFNRMTSWRLRYYPDSSGRRSAIDLYKDGTLVFHETGEPNAYFGEKKAYLKLGIYKWWWLSRPSAVEQRCLYYGDVDVWLRN